MCSNLHGPDGVQKSAHLIHGGALPVCGIADRSCQIVPALRLRGRLLGLTGACAGWIQINPQSRCDYECHLLPWQSLCAKPMKQLLQGVRGKQQEHRHHGKAVARGDEKKNHRESIDIKIPGQKSTAWVCRPWPNQAQKRERQYDAETQQRPLHEGGKLISKKIDIHISLGFISIQETKELARKIVDTFNRSAADRLPTFFVPKP